MWVVMLNIIVKKMGGYCVVWGCGLCCLVWVDLGCVFVVVGVICCGFLFYVKEGLLLIWNLWRVCLMFILLDDNCELLLNLKWLWFLDIFWFFFKMLFILYLILFLLIVLFCLVFFCGECICILDVFDLFFK